MPVSLLPTKLYLPPARPNVVSRPRLIEKLRAGLSQPGSFALLSGPAGFGKTALLSALIAQLGQPAAWVSLDEGDNDPIRFWTYVIHACQSVQDWVGQSALPLLRMAQATEAEAVASILINDLIKLDHDLVLVLDDYHVIQNEAIHKAFFYLIEHAPVNLHVVVSTRIDPPWPLARFRARNQLVEVRAQDLRFNLEETAAFLNHTMGLGLSAQDVAALESRTEGWIAGLQLAALSMQGRSDLASFVKAFTGSHVYVAEYLVEEVLERQAEPIQSFLLETSILERLHAELCDAVTERQDGQAVLDELHRANLFVLPLDDEGRWFRYHHLFADLLQARLRQGVTADKIAGLHQRASAWYGQHGFPVEAVNHALAAKDFEAAACLVEGYSFSMVIRGELATLMRWIELLPEELLQQHPLIVIAKAWALTLAGAVGQVEPLLQGAEAQIQPGEGSPAAVEFLGNAAAIRAFFAMMAGAYPRALELAERASTLLPERSVHVHWLLPYTLGAVYRAQGQYEKAIEAFARQAEMGETHDNLIVWATGVTEVAIVRRLQGRLREAAETCRQALQKMAARGAGGFGSLAKLEVPWIEVLREQNELEEAHRRVTGVIGRMQAWPMPTDRLFAYLALFQVRLAQGDFEGASHTLRMAKDLKAQHPVLANLARAVDLGEARLALQTGDLPAAERLMEALQPGKSPAISARDGELLLLARLRLTQGKVEEAQGILSPLAVDAGAGERKGALIETLALQACVQDALGEREAALAVLDKALALAEPEGYVRVFLDEGEKMRQLLVAVARHPEAGAGAASTSRRAYARKLLQAFGADLAPGVIPPHPGPAAELVEPLTARELEVLQLIAAGDSNRTIAGKLVITVSAVKKHTANIYGKLNVNSRTQAVARARQLGLLFESP